MEHHNVDRDNHEPDGKFLRKAISSHVVLKRLIVQEPDRSYRLPRRPVLSYGAVSGSNDAGESAIVHNRTDHRQRCPCVDGIKDVPHS